MIVLNQSYGLYTKKSEFEKLFIECSEVKYNYARLHTSADNEKLTDWTHK